jgi:RNA polymerase sigma-70 factor (ECF subfamily)
VRLIRENSGIIHKICHLYCVNHEDKRDLYQEIVLQLWKSYPSFQGKSTFSTWMYRVSLNTAISRTTPRRDFVGMESQQLGILSDQSDTLVRSEELRVLYRAIGILSKVERAVVLLWLEDKSYDEVAEITGLSVKNVSVRLVRIRKKLSHIIESID